MDIEVNMGELAVARGTDQLIASAIGSCLVITCYDPTRKLGAMAHTMLPSSTSHGRGQDGRDTKCVDAAIEEMLTRLQALGARPEDLEAKVIGAANMFRTLDSSLGQAMLESARTTLAQHRIPLLGESVGGSIGRSVEFSIASGIVTVKSKF